MNTADFDFHLPEELIAQTPLEKRRCFPPLVVNHETGQMEDTHLMPLLINYILETLWL